CSRSSRSRCRARRATCSPAFPSPVSPLAAKTRPKTSPKVGFVSLGCPKALVDSERILTQLRAEGYVTASDYAGADLVIVNTCGFIDAAVQESLEAIGEALHENGKVIVTGCLGAKDVVKKTHPSVLAITGPHDTQGVMKAVHVLHHPLDARRPRLAADRRGDAGSREPGEGGREGAARHLAGHQRIWCR